MSAGAPRRLALVVSKGSFAEAFSSLVLATSAAAMGWEAGIFFTFGGLELIRRAEAGSGATGPIEVSPELAARMNEAGFPDLPGFLALARELEIRFYACSTTMGLMGIGSDDLLDGCRVAGAAAFLDYAAGADVQLFV